LITKVADADWAAYDLPLHDRPRSAATPSPPLAEDDERLLLQNGAWFCTLRWLVCVVLVGLGVLAWTAGNTLLHYKIRLNPTWPFGTAAVLLAVNVTYLVLVRTTGRRGILPRWSSEQSPVNFNLKRQDAASTTLPNGQLASRALGGLWMQILVDLAVLTVVVHYLGSLETYAPFMYLFHIVLACIFFPPRQSLLVTLAAMGMYLTCILLESVGAIAPASVLASPLMPDPRAMPLPIAASYFCSVAFISGTVWYLASRLASALRQRDAELAATNRRLVAATEERAQYMLRTTHQLKAPFAAIHANAQLLLGGYCGPIPDRAVTVIEQIAARCEMLSRAIKDMLQLANLRSNATPPPQPVPIDLPALIRACFVNLKPQAAKRCICLDEDLLDAAARGVPDHVLMIIENVISNAINYSRDGQHVLVSCRPKPGGGATVVVRDRGIGIPAEKLPRIFDDYFRTNEAVAHNRASTGLGLAIVRQAAAAGEIGVHVESASAQGTVFALDFRAPHESEEPA
jgi:signal transduction histidine kinase